MTSGDHAPVVVPGDPAGSLLAQKMLGTQTLGAAMPMSGTLPLAEIQPHPGLDCRRRPEQLTGRRSRPDRPGGGAPTARLDFSIGHRSVRGQIFAIVLSLRLAVGPSCRAQLRLPRKDRARASRQTGRLTHSHAGSWVRHPTT